jgi:hypothetical protein
MVTVTGISLSGTDTANYALASTLAFTSADITGIYIPDGGSTTIQDKGSSVYVEMAPGQDASFSVDEQTGAPVQGFVGMGPGAGSGLKKTLSIFTDAPKGSFIALVEFQYTHAELTSSGISEADLRLYYWDTAAKLWKLAADGNTAGISQKMGDAAPPKTPLNPVVDLGKYGIDSGSNIVWAVVDYTADFGAGVGGGAAPKGVGGEVYPINKLSLLAPWLAFLAVISICRFIFARRSRRYGL